MTIFDTDEDEDVSLIEIQVRGQKAATAGVSESGVVYLNGEIHPLGSASALLTAAIHKVPYIEVSAVEVLYPADWLRAECLGDVDRQRIIDNAEAFVRGQKA